ncbi:hypothetical protein ACFQ60_22495 [Streptomyces zhihengii]|uniref:Uncharacterized protein n=1 Tax=Streptomyces zhihengii TaxID=1818004 RepID=A0ABS2UU88_9ACTN|nr:hypothetical protein [Streptomyces zhihengii]MBM9621010.1 hypothetical protein [Streptomyces zhihengii]
MERTDQQPAQPSQEDRVAALHRACAADYRAAAPARANADRGDAWTLNSARDSAAGL